MRSRRRFARSMPSFFFLILWQCCFFGRYHFFLLSSHFAKSNLNVVEFLFSVWSLTLFTFVETLVSVCYTFHRRRHIAAMVARKLMLLLHTVVLPCVLLSIGYHVCTCKKWCLCAVSSRMHNDPTEFVIAIIRIPIEYDAYMCWHTIEISEFVSNDEQVDKRSEFAGRTFTFFLSFPREQTITTTTKRRTTHEQLQSSIQCTSVFNVAFIFCRCFMLTVFPSLVCSSFVS